MMHTVSAATSAWVIYAFGNGRALGAILEGIRAICASDFFWISLKTVALVSILWIAVMASVFKARVVDMAKTPLIAAILAMLIVNYTVDIAIEDPIDPMADIVVADVPAIIGLPASALSQIGYKFARLFDEAFTTMGSLPSDLTLTGAGSGSGAPFNVGARMIADGAQYRIVDPYLKASLTHFVTDCMVPMIASQKITTNALLTSQDVWSLVQIGDVNPAIMTTYYGTALKPVAIADQVKTCQEAYSLINQALVASESEMANGLYQNWGFDTTTGLASQLFSETLDYVASSGSYTTTPGKYLQQAAMVSVLRDNTRLMMSNIAASNALTDQSLVTQADRQAVSSWRYQASVFEATFGYLYAFLEILVLAMGPMVLLLLAFPGGGSRLFTNYVKLLVWFPLTWVLLAISNAVLTQWLHSSVGAVWDQYQGLSVLGQPFISVRSATILAVGGYVDTLMPMLAFAMVFSGGYALNQFLSGIGANQFGNGAATQAVTGNITQDSQSYDNLQSGQTNTAKRVDMGVHPAMLHAMATDIGVKADAGGVSAFINGAPINQSETSQETVQSGMSDQSHLNHSASIDQNENLSESLRFEQSMTEGERQAYSAIESQSGTREAKLSNSQQSELSARLSGTAGGIIKGLKGRGVKAGLLSAEGELTAAGKIAQQELADGMADTAMAARTKGAAREGFIQGAKERLQGAYAATTEAMGGGAVGKAMAAGAAGVLVGAAIAAIPEEAAVAGGVAVAEEGTEVAAAAISRIARFFGAGVRGGAEGVEAAIKAEGAEAAATEAAAETGGSKAWKAAKGIASGLASGLGAGYSMQYQASNSQSLSFSDSERQSQSEESSYTQNITEALNTVFSHSEGLTIREAASQDLAQQESTSSSVTTTHTHNKTLDINDWDGLTQDQSTFPTVQHKMHTTGREMSQEMGHNWQQTQKELAAGSEAITKRAPQQRNTPLSETVQKELASDKETVSKGTGKLPPGVFRQDPSKRQGD